MNPESDPSAQPEALQQHTLDSSVFRETLEQADIAVSITDGEANILYVNPAFTRVTGYAPEEAIGRNQSLLSNKTTPRTVYASLWRKISGGQPWAGRLVNRRRDGTPYLADLAITPVRNADGLTVNYLGMHRDITILHELECQVRNQKALIESVVDTAPLLIALLDANRRVVLDNHAYKKLMADLGMQEPAQQILAAAGLEPTTPIQEEPGEFIFQDREVCLQGKGWGTPRWFSCSLVTVEEDDATADAFFVRQRRRYLLLTATDITNLRAEQEKSRMAALRAVLAEAERIDGLRESLSAAIYQLEGPINVISSAVAMLARRSQSEPMANALADAVAAGQAALENLRSEIPPARFEEREAVSLNELLRDVLELSTRSLLAAGIVVNWAPAARLPSLVGYPNRLRAMFKALVDNALEAMNVKGWRERELNLSTRATRNSIDVVIEDSGPGIPAELRLRVFEPFFSTKKGGGRHLGTGLSAAQQTANDHGGLIEIDDAAGRGCRIRLSFPLRNSDGGLA